MNTLKPSCFNCKFAKDFRNHVRQGEQVRCGKAEELFGTDNIKGGERWVDVRKGKNGQDLKPRCGEHEEFEMDELIKKQAHKPTQGRVKVQCSTCNGAGRLRVKVMLGYDMKVCTRCNGKGSVSKT